MSDAVCAAQLRLPKIKGNAKKRELATQLISRHFEILQEYARDFERCGDAVTAERCLAAAKAYESTVLSLFHIFAPRMTTSMVIEHEQKFQLLRVLWTKLEVVDYTERIFAERTLSYRNPLDFNPHFEGCRKNRCTPLHAVTDPYSVLILMGNSLLSRRFEQAAGCYYRAAETYAAEIQELIRRKGAEANCCYMVSNRKQFIQRSVDLLEWELISNGVPHVQQHRRLLSA